MSLQNKIAYFTIGAASIIFLAGILFFKNDSNIPEAQAAPGDRILTGFAWSENIGWVSFNSLNCDMDDNEQVDAGAPAGCPLPTGTSLKRYNVFINATDQLSGYAWSSNIGWIKFDPVGPYPTCPSGVSETCPAVDGGNPDYPARYNSASKKITGWARACAGTVNGDCNSATRTDGWDGWILLGPINKGGAGNKGVWINNTGILSGWAWGSDVVGWISFNCNTGTCSLSNNYKVSIANSAPTISGITYQSPTNYCGPSTPDYIFKWTFNDSDLGDTEKEYRIQIDNNSDFSSPTVDRSFTGLSNPSGTENSQTVSLAVAPDSPGSDKLAYGKTYYWQVRVRDSADNFSVWQSGANFNTEPNPYPKVGFAPPEVGTTASFLVNIPINFKVSGNSNSADNTRCYPGAGTDSCNNWEWDFDYDGSTFTLDIPPDVILGTNGSTTHTYLDVGSFKVKLKVTDIAGHSCYNTSDQEIITKQAKWKEVIPVN